MACPPFEEFLRPVLQIFADHSQDLELPALRSCLLARLDLEDETNIEALPSVRSVLFSSRADWACFYLAAAGLLAWVRPDTYRIAPRGREVIAGMPARIDVAFLGQFAEFRTWMSGGHSAASGPAASETIAGAAVTPDEQIEKGCAARRRAVKGELLSRILAASPVVFEALLMELLVTRGWVSSPADAGGGLAPSGEDGLDGILYDRWEQDAIYFHVRRCDPSTYEISRRDAEAFAASLGGHSARKGVFMTTTSFTPEARDHLWRLDANVVLVDGPRLADLLFRENVGVRVMRTINLEEVDGDRFVEEQRPAPAAEPPAEG